MKKTLLKLSVLLFGAAIAFTSCKSDPGPEDPETPDTKYSYVEEDGIVYATVKDFGKGTGTITFSNDTVWNLDGLVYVNKNQTLTIQPGTIVRGLAGQGDRASALVVARGGMIDAEGTVTDPIIFTSEFDKVEVSGGKLALEGTKTAAESNLWGGVIVLGYAEISRAAGVQSIEGIASTESRGKYGGTDNNDNSGILKYISIQHGGTNIGAGNEINGLTLGGVGAGTTIDYVEVVSNQDDGIECFGGNVDISHAVVAFSGDDSFDFDEGYTGNMQFLVVIENDTDLKSEISDSGNEADGGPSDCRLCDPRGYPVIYNATFIGTGATNAEKAFHLKEFAGGEYHNILVWGFGKGFELEDIDGDVNDVVGRFNATADNTTSSELIIDNVSYDVIGATNFIADQDGNAITGVDATVTAATLDLANSQAVGGIDVKGANITGATPPSADFDENATYRGAIDPAASGNGWLDDWTFLDQRGFFVD